jgi:hypothetical protein
MAGVRIFFVIKNAVSKWVFDHRFRRVVGAVSYSA